MTDESKSEDSENVARTTFGYYQGKLRHSKNSFLTLTQKIKLKIKRKKIRKKKS